MAKKNTVKEQLDGAQRIKPGTPEMESFLAVGYGMEIKEAELIVKEREANPASHPYELYSKARAMLAAYKAKPQVISNKPGGMFFGKDNPNRE